MSFQSLFIIIFLSLTHMAMAQSEPTKPFRDEHQEIHAHLDDIQKKMNQLGNASRQEQLKTMQNVVAFLQNHLIPHAEWEEQVLYPAVDKYAGYPITTTMRYEHQIVNRWIKELASELAGHQPDMQFFSQRLGNLLGLLYAHFEEEEKVLLPILDKKMSPEQFQKEIFEKTKKNS